MRLDPVLDLAHGLCSNNYVCSHLSESAISILQSWLGISVRQICKLAKIGHLLRFGIAVHKYIYCKSQAQVTNSQVTSNIVGGASLTKAWGCPGPSTCLEYLEFSSSKIEDSKD